MAIFSIKIKWPVILPLLVVRIIVGSFTGIIDAGLLFKGSLPHKFKDLSCHGSIAQNLSTVGALITWVIAAPIAYYAKGIRLANIKRAEVVDILEFKETLSVLLISCLFILLVSSIDLSIILNLGWGAGVVLISYDVCC